MIGVIDRDQRIDTGGLRRLEFVELQLALVGREHTEIDTLQANGWLLQLNEHNARNGLQDVGRGLNDAGHARMFVQRQAQVDTPTQMRPELVKPRSQET